MAGDMTDDVTDLAYYRFCGRPISHNGNSLNCQVGGEMRQ